MVAFVIVICLQIQFFVWEFIANILYNIYIIMKLSSMGNSMILHFISFSFLYTILLMLILSWSFRCTGQRVLVLTPKWGWLHELWVNKSGSSAPQSFFPSIISFVISLTLWFLLISFHSLGRVSFTLAYQGMGILCCFCPSNIIWSSSLYWIKFKLVFVLVFSYEEIVFFHTIWHVSLSLILA